MRRLLDLLFRASGALAAVFMVGICALVMAQIVGRMMGVLVPSADEFAGYCLAASSFLALAYTLRTDSHIRVTLLLGRVPPRHRAWIEVVCVFAGLFLSLYLTYFTLDMIRFSLVFGDVTQGLVPIPLWIPQASMGIGTVLLSLAFVVDAVEIVRGRQPSYVQAERVAEAERAEARAGVG